MSKQPLRGSTSRKDEKGDKCANCSKSVGEKEMGIQCEICSAWFHSKCVDISAEVYSFMEKNKNVHWYCDSCNKGVACVIEEVSKLKLRQDLMDQSLKEIRSEIVELKIGIMKMDTKKETAIEVKLLDVVEKKLEHKVESKVDESMDIERRKYNLVVQGIKEEEGTDDEKIIDELMSSLHCAPRNVEEINRIGRKAEGRIRPVRIVMR